MTYGEARDLSLHLVHQQSIAGETIPGTYNNQQDYLDKIPGLINAAQMDLATTAARIPMTTFLRDLVHEDMGSARVYTLPEDMWQRRGSGILTPIIDPYTQMPRYTRFNQVQMIGNNKVILPRNLPEASILEYFRYPNQLPALPEDTAELDNTPLAQTAVPFYVAAHLVIQDDAFLYASLYNEYESKKASMIDMVYTEPGVVEDVFGVNAVLYDFWG